MANQIQTLFNDLGSDLTIDPKLIKKLHNFERSFCHRNKDHVEFFGGNLMGVNPIRFKAEDRDTWFIELLQMDELELKDRIAGVKAIKKEWKRASDPVNLSCVWLLHTIFKSKLSVAQKKQGMVTTLLILQYKFLASLMAHYYRYPADKEVMEAAYASLSKRYALKAAGSWNKLLQERAEEIISSTGIHRKTYQRFNDDEEIIKMINDIQSRLRKIIKTMTAVFYKERAKGARIGTAKDILEIDGEKILKDKTKKFSSYIRYLHQVSDDSKSFIRKDLVDVILDIHRTCDKKRLLETLEWCAVNHRVQMKRWKPKVQGAYVEEFYDEVLLYAFSLVTTKNNLVIGRSNLATLLNKLRSLYMASRMVDPSLLKTKEMAENIVRSSIKSKNASVISSVRTALQLYIVARSLTADHYS